MALVAPIRIAVVTVSYKMTTGSLSEWDPDASSCTVDPGLVAGIVADKVGCNFLASVTDFLAVNSSSNVSPNAIYGILLSSEDVVRGVATAESADTRVEGNVFGPGSTGGPPVPNPAAVPDSVTTRAEPFPFTHYSVIMVSTV